jgi:transcriptional regulator with XRE-family HTH domain
VRLGVWLRELREDRGLPLRAVADATEMDLAHLHKIEQGHRLPTEDQTSRLARFFELDETETQAQRIAEKFRQEFAGNPAAREAISILAEETDAYGAEAGGGEHPSPRPSPLRGVRERLVAGKVAGES